MSETLGSLIDKLAIANLRLWQGGMLASRSRASMCVFLSQGKSSLKALHSNLSALMFSSERQPSQMSETLGSLIDKLTIANLRLWHLEEVKHDDQASDF